MFKPFAVNISLSSFTVRLLKEVVVSLSSFFCFDDWPLGPGGAGWGSTEALLERRVERRGCSSGAGDGDFDDRPRFLGALAAAATSVTAVSYTHLTLPTILRV